MPTVEVRRATGERAGTVTLDPTLFEVTPNVPVMHQVVTAQLAAARAGGHSTLTRAEVRGGGRKPWRQKGSGRARQGSSRAPHWRGGGVAAGPRPRSYRQRTPKKMIQLALRSALSDRAGENRVVVVDAWPFEVPRTKDAKALLETLELEGGVLVVLGGDDHVAERSFRNLPDVQLVLASELNAYDVLCNDWVLFTRATLPGATGEGPPAEPAPATDDAAGPQASAAPSPAEPPDDTDTEGSGAAPTSPSEAGEEHDWESPLRGRDS